MSADLLAWHVEHHGGAFETCLARVCAKAPTTPPARCGRCGQPEVHENHVARVRARRMVPRDHDYQPPPPADYGFVIDGTGEPGPRVPAWGFTTPPPADPAVGEPGDRCRVWLTPTLRCGAARKVHGPGLGEIGGHAFDADPAVGECGCRHPMAHHRWRLWCSQEHGAFCRSVTAAWPPPAVLAGERGRLLAERDRLVSQGAEPADLLVPDREPPADPPRVEPGTSQLPIATDLVPAAPWVEPHPEAFCQRCNGPNVVWYAPSPLWNAVMRRPDGSDVFGIVCPPCFAEMAVRSGVVAGDRVVWRFSADPGVTPAAAPPIAAGAPVSVEALADAMRYVAWDMEAALDTEAASGQPIAWESWAAAILAALRDAEVER